MMQNRVPNVFKPIHFEVIIFLYPFFSLSVAMPSGLVIQMIYGRVNPILWVFFIGSVFGDVKCNQLLVTKLTLIEDTKF